jgi:hypothetical protein
VIYNEKRELTKGVIVGINFKSDYTITQILQRPSEMIKRALDTRDDISEEIHPK